MALSADPGVSTTSLPPSPQAEKLSPALGSLPDLPAGWLGCRPGTREDRDLQGGRGFASNLPRGSGLDWRAELPHGLGAMRERGRRWRRGGSRDVRQQSSQLAGKVLGGALEVSCLGRGHRGWERGGAGEERCAEGNGGHPARQAQLRAEEATGLGRVPTFPGWGRALGGWRSFPQEAELPGTALGGRLLLEPAQRAA